MPSSVAKLRFFRHLDAPGAWLGSRASLSPRDARHFAGDGVAAALARELCRRRAVAVKELFEATESFALARKAVRRPVVADLCCGHGLAGILFALMERDVERVLLVDRERPPNADVVLDVAAGVAPWVREKVEYRETRLNRFRTPEGAGTVAIHACGLRTDAAIEAAIAAGGPIAALPCCRPHRKHPAPEGLKLALGHDVAIDVHRTYALERAGYRVRWKSIDAAITPMNRLLIARRAVDQEA